MQQEYCQHIPKCHSISYTLEKERDVSNLRCAETAKNPLQTEEKTIRWAWEKKEYQKATTLLLKLYGTNILAFFFSRLRNESEAYEVFSIFCEDLWRGFPGFLWRCSAKGWAFALARHAMIRFRKKQTKYLKRHVRLSNTPELMMLAKQIRTTTLPYLQTENKNRFRELRDQLSEADQTLLILRVDQKLSWKEIAFAFLPKHSNDLQIDKESVRLRKRFQLLKNKLKTLAKQQGLIPS